MIKEIINMDNNGWDVEDISVKLGISKCYILEILEDEELS